MEEERIFTEEKHILETGMIQEIHINSIAEEIKREHSGQEKQTVTKDHKRTFQKPKIHQNNLNQQFLIT